MNSLLNTCKNFVKIRCRFLSLWSNLCTVVYALSLLQEISFMYFHQSATWQNLGCSSKELRVRNLWDGAGCQKDCLYHVTYCACRWSCWSFLLCCADINVSVCSLGERWEFTDQNTHCSRTRQSELEGQKLSKRLNVHKYRESTYTRHPSSEILSSCLDCIEIQLSAN